MNYNSEGASKSRGSLPISMVLSELVINIRDRGKSNVDTVFRQGLGTSSQNNETSGHSHFSGAVVSHGRKKSLTLLELFSILGILRACGGERKS